MGKYEKFLVRIIHGGADKNIRFDSLCSLLLRLGFNRHIAGSHHLFRKEGIKEMINLQQDGSYAKPYQVRQVRGVILKYQLGDRNNV